MIGMINSAERSKEPSSTVGKHDFHFWKTIKNTAKDHTTNSTRSLGRHPHKPRQPVTLHRGTAHRHSISQSEQSCLCSSTVDTSKLPGNTISNSYETIDSNTQMSFTVPSSQLVEIELSFLSQELTRVAPQRSATGIGNQVPETIMPSCLRDEWSRRAGVVGDESC